jgi:rhamnogalacturonan endolyase
MSSLSRPQAALALSVGLLLLPSPAVPLVSAQSAAAAVTLTENAATYTLDNGIVKAQVAKSSGDLVSLRFKDLEMLATFYTEEGQPDLTRDPPGENKAGLNRGMTDHQYGFWSHDAMGRRDSHVSPVAKITIDPKANNGERAEVSVKGLSNGRRMGTGPGAAAAGDFIADVELRFALGKGEAGVYTYCIFDHPAAYAATTITEARFCAKLADFFDWMSVADDEHHHKHYPKELREGDKYVYTTNQFNNRAFGWSSTTRKVGFFLLNASMEYMSGGPTKVEFLGHRDTNRVAAPCVLNYWRSSHYGGAEVSVAAGEKWSKVIGPFLLYVNAGADPQALYQDARARAAKESAQWPYAWVKDENYPTAAQRATVKGRLVLNDPLVPAVKMSNVLVGLAAPAYRSPGTGRPVDWQRDAKHYQFWVRGSDDGTFAIPAVRPGTYTLHAFADGVLGEFAKTDVAVEGGKALDLGKVNWTPVRRGAPLWEIGIPNRSGKEFLKGDVFWMPNISQSYATLFPKDIVYTIGKSDYTKDWFFQQVPRGPDQATSYSVVFDLANAPRGRATLRIAFAGNQARSLAVTVNGQPAGQLTLLTTDGTLSRHGSHGLWNERELSFDAALMKQGQNTLQLTVPGGATTAGVIYDYLRLELDETAR